MPRPRPIPPTRGDDSEPRAPAHPWDGLLVGPENSLAFGAAQALARGDSSAVSPLLLYGPSGTGKSRLLAGLIVEFLDRHPGASVAHLDGAAFAALCAEATTYPEGWADLRARFRSLDLLALDDLQALERAPLAQSELSATLDSLIDAGARVALAANTSPSQWKAAHARSEPGQWPPRLLSRLKGGLSIAIDPPTPTLLRRYLLERASAAGLVLATGAIDLLGEKADGFRTIEGWVARLALMTRVEPNAARARAGAISAERVEALLNDETEPNASADLDSPRARTAAARGMVAIHPIARVVARQFGVTLRELRGPSRRAGIVTARHLAIHLARTWTGQSFATIGYYFGRRDTKSIRHACSATQARLKRDPALAAAAHALEAVRPTAARVPNEPRPDSG